MDNFFFVGPTEREEVDQWLKEASPRTGRQIKFIKSVRAARAEVNYDYWISTVEPSISEKGDLTFKSGAEVFRGLSFKAWRKKAKKFFHEGEKHSDIATESELLVWYGYRVAHGLVSFHDGCDNSRYVGNYIDSPTAHHVFEKSGVRCVDGLFADGAGNTVRIARNGEDNFVTYGGFMGDRGEIAMFRRNAYAKRDENLIQLITSPAVVIKAVG